MVAKGVNYAISTLQVLCSTPHTLNNVHNVVSFLNVAVILKTYSVYSNGKPLMAILGFEF